MPNTDPGYKLLDGVTADGSGTAVAIPDGGHRYKDKLFGFYVWSTNFGGGTVTIQISLDNTNWFPARTQADSQLNFTVSDHLVGVMRGIWVRATLAGATAPAAVNARMY